MKKTKTISLSQPLGKEKWKKFNKLPDLLEISNFGRVRTIARMTEYYSVLGNLVQVWLPSRSISVNNKQTEPKFRCMSKDIHNTYNLLSELKEHFGDDWFYEHHWNGISYRRGTMINEKEPKTVVDGGPCPEAKNTVTEIKIKVGVDAKFRQLMEIAMETNDYNTRRKLLELCMEISNNGKA